MTFTGITREHLESSHAPRGAAELLRQTDLLIDGPYLAHSPDRTRPWVGSTNQGFHFLTDRYRGLESRLSTIGDRVEVRITPAGEVQVNGWATVDQLDDLLAGSTPAVGRGRVR
jgi:anaerobic ribonucleoside-triphosphate reductase activating protein